MPRPDPEKIREWRKRSKKLSPGEGPKRKTPIKKENKPRRKKMYARNYGERADAIRAMPCLCLDRYQFDQLVECEGRTVAAHAEPRRWGGCGGDRRKQVNLCVKHEREAGELRTSQRAAFEAKWDVDLMAEAAKLAEQLDAAGYP